MTTTRNQRIAMAAIVAVGLAACAAVLLAGRHGEDGHADHGHGPEQRQDQGQAGATAGKPEPAAPDAMVRLDAARTEAAGIGLAVAGPAQLQSSRDFQGEIRFNEDRTAHVVPRLDGVAQAVPANLGQQVRRDQVLAVIASASLSGQRSEWLTAQRRVEAARVTFERERTLWLEKISAEQDYLQAQAALREAEIAAANAGQKLAAVGASATARDLNRLEARAPFDGTIVEKHLTLGEAVKEDTRIFTISDLSTVWAEFAVGPRDLALAQVGREVVVSSTASPERVRGVVSYVGALLGEQTRTARARVTLANPQGAWRPGLFVTVSVFGTPQAVPLSVPSQAVLTIDNQPTVFKAVPGGFRATRVQTGRTDGTQVEILEGLQAGDRVAAANAFVLKAELGKAGTTHAH